MVGVVVHVRLVAGSLIHRSTSHLNHPWFKGKARDGTGGERPPLPRRCTSIAFIFAMNPPNNALIRQQLRAQRLTLSTAQQQAAAHAVAQHVTTSAEFNNASNIGAYWAWNAELDPAPLLEQAWALGKSVYLPVLDGDLLQFAAYLPNSTLRPNRFRIPEPDVIRSAWLAPAALDIVLTPLVAFDANGMRLGMGGGFYDRSFAFLSQRSEKNKPPLLIGLAYAFQEVPLLLHQPWDVPLYAVATENHYRRFPAVWNTLCVVKEALNN